MAARAASIMQKVHSACRPSARPWHRHPGPSEAGHIAADWKHFNDVLGGLQHAGACTSLPRGPARRFALDLAVLLFGAAAWITRSLEIRRSSFCTACCRG